MPHHELNLNGFTFQELFTHEGLKRLDESFLQHLLALDPLCHEKLLTYREGVEFGPNALSELLLELGQILEIFLADLFGIEEAVGRLQLATLSHDPVIAFKKYFVLREAKRNLKKADDLPDFSYLNNWLNKELAHHSIAKGDEELRIARLAQTYLEDPQAFAEPIHQLTAWCVQAMASAAGRAHVTGWVSFKLPAHLNYENLVQVETVPGDKLARQEGLPAHFRQRDGFNLTDERMSAREVQDEVNYCVYCHKNTGDFCSKGFPVKKNKASLGLKVNPVGDTLTGCPLEEKISEMHALKRDGFTVAALAMVMVDNPMCPATGHRICNDCMKACIYQKQEPVNIPQIETRILTDVLDLPWGVEIYDLLTRWNPLRQTQWLIKPYNGLKVLVMGMGPAGFTLAHHLLMEGFAVVGADGLKIEPLARELIEQPIAHFADLHETLDDRVMAGFGGVAEYGITVRWDKNFLKLIYICLMRRKHFQVFGSVRFGGTLKVEDAWRLGFDHLVVAVGAGLPRELAIPGSLAPGMRQANDFLMALQLTGAAKRSSLANLQIRLPSVVIGGGLTGVDTATEIQAYYITQVEKIALRYEIVTKYYSEETIRKKFSEQDLLILDEFLAHAQLVKQTRERARATHTKPDFLSLIRNWGGVTIAYRRSMQESPAYKRNHEELAKAFEEGIYYAQGLSPKAVILDDYGNVNGLRCEAKVMDEVGQWQQTDEEPLLPAKSIFVATGAKPNIAYEFENKGTFERNGFEYARHEWVDKQLKQALPVDHVKMGYFGPFTSYQQDHRLVSFIGDTHPVFHGSVVKAIASAKRAYPKITAALNGYFKYGDENEYQEFAKQMEGLFRAQIISVERIGRRAVKLIVRAPMAAAHFQPANFYRIQSYETLAPIVGNTRLQTEALALLGMHDPAHRDQLSFIALEDGVSSRLVATLQPGERVSVMGPSGVRFKIADQPEHLMIIGGRMAALYVLAIAPALKEQGSRITFVATFADKEDIICRDQLEALTDRIIWVNENELHLQATRMQDKLYYHDIVSSLREYALSEQGDLALAQVDRVLVVGPGSLLRTIQKARSTLLKEYFADDVSFIAAVHGPMQCMLKGVCAQCLQWQIDPRTGKRTKAVYACSWHNQPMELIDINNIDERLAQNRMQETLSSLWLDYLFETEHVARV